MPALKRRTLAEDLAELANPAPVQEFDPDAQDYGEAAWAQEQVEEDEDDIDVARHSKQQAPSGLRLRAGIALEDGEYTGRTGSRQAFEDAEESPYDEDQDGEEEDEEEEDDEDAGDDDMARRLASSEEAGPSGTDVDFEREGAEEDAELEIEYQRLRAEEELTLSKVRAQGEDDKQKGLAVKHQKELWERCLKWRIALQKLLPSANRLPEPHVRRQYCSASEVARAIKDVASTAARTVDTLLEVHKALADQNSAVGSIPPAVEVSQQESGVDGCWQRIQQQMTRVEPFQVDALDRWHRKTSLAAGASVAKGQLRAINQSISSQVATIMADPERVVKRARCRRSQVRVFGQGEGVETTTPSPDDDVLEETYDDTEFYQALLKEFLETNAPTAADGVFTLKARNRTRKVVDRRASKGRKIRYNLQDPLVSFMAPQPIELSSMTSQLFSRLFGGAGQAEARLDE
eukprot:jgi/Chlat1/6521/Chrsp45S06002